MEYETKCIVVSRFKREDDNDFKSVIVHLYEINNGHLDEKTFPREELKYSNIKKVKFKDMEVHAWLEGMDLVVNDLEKIKITEEPNNKLLIEKV